MILNRTPPPQRGQLTPDEPKGAAGRMSRVNRQRELASYVLDHGTVTVIELVERFDVSQMTVHRHLTELERQGVVRRFRGGASAQPSGVFESNVLYRMSAMQKEKAAIARHARGLIEPGMSLLLDEGTTTLALAQLLAAYAPLTVITNYLETIKVVSEMSEIRLISLGGEYLKTHDSFIGVQCIENARSLRPDLAILSTSAIGDGQAFHQEQEIVLVKRAMMDSASRRVLLVDHSKLSTVALNRFASLDEFDLVITDDAASSEQIEDLANHSVAYQLAPMNGEEGDE
jgi:DeoR/GlpR family transcriptional regulator of sugar metabolism